MLYYALLALAPFVGACTNPDSDPCASFMTAQVSLVNILCFSFWHESGPQIISLKISTPSVPDALLTLEKGS